MKRTLLISLVLLLSTTAAYAQKVTTILGDAWVGIVVTADASTREIKLRHPDSSKKDTFSGFLVDEYKVKLKDGTWRFLQMSEIEPGARIRVFYKSTTRDVGGQKVKVFSIHRLDFLGIDKYDMLREALNVPPATAVAVNKDTKLPAANPLRLFLSIQQPNFKKHLIEFVADWNKREGEKQRRIEIVTELSNSDASLVSFWGRDDLVALLPALAGFGDGELNEYYPASIYLVTKDNDTIKVLWEKFVMMPREKLEGEYRLDKEIEKLLKAAKK
jgi:hypothetical protein